MRQQEAYPRYSREQLKVYASIYWTQENDVSTITQKSTENGKLFHALSKER